MGLLRTEPFRSASSDLLVEEELLWLWLQHQSKQTKREAVRIVIDTPEF